MRPLFDAREAYRSGGRAASSSDGSRSANPKISLTNELVPPDRRIGKERRSDAVDGRQKLPILAAGIERNEQLAVAGSGR